VRKRCKKFYDKLYLQIRVIVLFLLFLTFFSAMSLLRVLFHACKTRNQMQLHHVLIPSRLVPPRRFINRP